MKSADWSQQYKSHHVVDYQIDKSECAGMQPGKTNQYMSRSNKMQKKEASIIKKHSYKGRYD